MKLFRVENGLHIMELNKSELARELPEVNKYCVFDNGTPLLENVNRSHALRFARNYTKHEVNCK